MYRHDFTAFVVLLVGVTIVWSARARGDDWPTYGHDTHRGSATNESLALPLHRSWTYRSVHGPRPAWPPPAKHDYWHDKHGLHSRIAYDRVFQPILVGNHVYFGSSADDRIVCLDGGTGRLVWSYFTQGPVRLAPTVADGRLYAGSDDGFLYCLAAVDGRLLWKVCSGPADRRVIGNGRVISRWPIRSSVVVADGRAYCAGGLFPVSERVYLISVDARTGKQLVRHAIQQPAEGYLAVSGDRLYVPSGRTAPGVFDLTTGKPVGSISSPGGTYALVADEVVASGPGDTQGELMLSERHTRRQLVSVPGLHLIADERQWFIHSRTQVSALDCVKFLPLAKRQATISRRMAALEKDKSGSATQETVRLKTELGNLHAAMRDCRQWATECHDSESFIRAGNTLFTGGDGRVTAYRTSDGQQVWQTQVDGRACGLAVAGSRLVVSTSAGNIYCFESRHGDELQANSLQAAGGSKSNNNVEQLRSASSDLVGTLLAQFTDRRGFAVVAGARQIDLATALALKTEMRVMIAEPDVDQITQVRQQLDEQGLYGNRIVVHEVGGGALPYPPYFANLIVLDQATVQHGTATLRSWAHLVRPHGGTMWILGLDSATQQRVEAAVAETSLTVRSMGNSDMKTLILTRRDALAGAGEWTHGLADPANTACSRDQRVRGPLHIQWFGGPGPRLMPDRHHRNVPPLYKNGRMFVPGDNIMLAIDAYNETELWRQEIPDSIRLGVFLDCTSTVVDDAAVYLAADDICHVFDQTNGRLLRRVKMPQLVEDHPHRWGYVARTDSLLIGSGCRIGAAYQQQSHQADEALWYDNMALVTSDYLFGLEPNGNSSRWTYRSGVVVNTTLTIGDGRIYFLESHAPKALAATRGRATMADLRPGPNFVVALDVATGKQLWRQPFSLENCRHIVYLNYADGHLLLSGNKYIQSQLWYYFYALSATDGTTQWTTSHNTGYAPDGGHGEQNRHPTIVGDVVYTYPYAYELATGKKLPDWKFDRQGHGCGNISASACSLFWRGGNPWQWDLVNDRNPRPVNRVTRPGCFINMIPAGGLLLIPEASSGCTCQFPVQTSLAYIPENDLEPPIAPDP